MILNINLIILSLSLTPHIKRVQTRHILYIFYLQLSACISQIFNIISRFRNLNSLSSIFSITAGFRLGEEYYLLYIHKIKNFCYTNVQLILNILKSDLEIWFLGNRTFYVKVQHNIQTIIQNYRTVVRLGEWGGQDQWDTTLIIEELQFMASIERQENELGNFCMKTQNPLFRHNSV